MSINETFKLFEEYGINIKINKIELLNKYYELVINYPANLTNFRSYRDFFLYAVIDSILPLSHINIGRKVLDIGSGGGIPAIPLAIIYEKKDFTLVESSRKKAHALAFFVKELGLRNINIINTRVENLGRIYFEKFDTAILRAVARADVSLEYSAPYVKVMGKVILFKGKSYLDDEKVYAQKACEILGLIEKKVIKYNIEDKERLLVIYKKKGKTPKGFPRKPGIPEKRPLGGRFH